MDADIFKEEATSQVDLVDDSNLPDAEEAKHTTTNLTLCQDSKTTTCSSGCCAPGHERGEGGGSGGDGGERGKR